MLVKIIEQVNSYEEAIKITCDELIHNGNVTEDYYPAILQKVLEFGPYFCIADGIAMPHARPEDGVIKSEVCLLKLNTPVDFLGKQIALFLTLCAVDNSSHLNIMKQIASICMNQDTLNQILASKTVEDIIRKVV
ncbi:PTS sugar transporter subunit IIA [Candidatus Epulonipiscium viviparus]|uniref:PTS sugar transporter subunit IIA n=1 Tax=Candidatus Epulonipiscium viviparus TaxID=420336 RepID=UPI002738121A|nr:PTS sugar transporter subunit IIA [Candidatus Epulopiscium viviparus]